MSIVYTGSTCIRTSLRGLFNCCSRTWVNQEIQRWVKKMFRLLNISCTVYNPHKVKPHKGKPTIIMANHSSLFDIPVGLYAFPNETIRMLSKKEMGHIPLMKYGMTAAEFPFINRQKKKEAIRDLKKVKRLLRSGVVMWIFVEGTRSNTGTLGPLKKGGFITAIETGATIIPLGIRGAFSILPNKTLDFTIGQHTEIHIGQPIEASNYSLEQRDDLMEVVRESLLILTGETNDTHK